MIVQKGITIRILRWFIILIVVPFFLILLLEGTLRLFHYGYSTRLTEKTTLNGTEYYINNPCFNWQYYNPALSRQLMPFRIKVNKTINTFRIFILGESAALGDPSYEFGFSRILQKMLQIAYPEIEFEVVNVAVTGINSNIIQDITKECLRYGPDLFLLYMGNNEFIGPYSPVGLPFNFLSKPCFIKTSLWLRKTKIYQLIQNVQTSLSDDGVSWKGMSMFLNSHMPHSGTSIVYSNFEKNLENIISTLKKKNIPVISSTISVNYKDCAPLWPGTNAANKEKFAKLNQEILSFETEKKYREALQKYDELLALDTLCANTHYQLANCLINLGDTLNASHAYKNALNFDLLRFRADSRINAVIKTTSSKLHVACIDTDSLLNSFTLEKVAGNNFFWEHVHFNYSGNFLLASFFIKPVSEILTRKYVHKPAIDLDSISPHYIASVIGYTVYEQLNDVQNVLYKVKKEPFTGRPGNIIEVTRLTDFENRIKNITKSYKLEIRDQYLWALQNTNKDVFLCWKYANYLSKELGNYQEALNYYKYYFDFFPNDYKACLQIGLEYGKLENIEEAEKYMLHAVTLNKFYWPVYNSLGLLYQAKALYSNSHFYFKKALKLNPNNPLLFENAAFLAYNDKDFKSAKNYCQKALKLDSASVNARKLLVILNKE